MLTAIGNFLSFHRWYIVIGLVTLVIMLHLIWRRSKVVEKPRKQIPSFSPIPYLVALFTVLIHKPLEQLRSFDPSDYLLQWQAGIAHLYHKEKMIQGVWAGKRLIVCFDPSEAEKIFHSSVALDKDKLYRLLHPWLGTGLLTSGGEKWRNRRKMLTPAFHFRILKDFLLIFNEQSKILVDKLDKVRGEVVNITSIVALCTLDIIGESAMGVRLKAQDGECTEYVHAVEHLTSATVKPFTSPWYWITPLYRLTPAGKEMKKNLAIVHNFTRKVIRKRKEKFLEEEEMKEIIDDFQDVGDNAEMKKKRAFLDLLLYYHLKDNNISEEEIREEVDTFTFEGHDTTSMAMSWVLYLLGWHKDIQEKVYLELRKIFSDNQELTISAYDLKEMKYTECVIKEALRLYPSVPFIIRRTSKDIETDKYIIPADSSVTIYIYSIHRDPDVYPNPDVFDPDRFLPENSAQRHPFAYVPFSAGYRNCIGNYA